MKMLVSEIPIEKLTECELKFYRKLADKPFGEKLAHAVVEKLKKKPRQQHGLYFLAKGYCGLGIFAEKYGKITLRTVIDGLAAFPVICTFNSSEEEEFVQWLSSQSDRSMSLYGEQFTEHILSRARLTWYLQDNYSPSWSNDVLNTNPIRGIQDWWGI